MIKKIYEETDAIGKHKVIEQKNGIKVRILREPSKEYAEKMAARSAIAAERQAVEKEKQDIRRKIEEEKQRQAIQTLLDNGTLTQEELDKIGE